MNMSNNIITLKSVYGKVESHFYIQPCPDPRTGKLPACVKRVNSQGDMILTENERNSGDYFIPETEIFDIIDGTTFNLDDPYEKAKWEAIKNCKWIAQNRYAKDANGDFIIDGDARHYGVASLYVERPGEITKTNVSRKERKHKAEHYIFEDSAEDRLKRVKILGRDMRNAPDSDVTDYLLGIAEKTPDKIITLYEGEDWQLQLFIADALEKGVIRKKDNIYKYDEFILGASINATIVFLKDKSHNKLYQSMKMETYPELMLSKEEYTAPFIDEELTDLTANKVVTPQPTTNKRGPQKI